MRLTVIGATGGIGTHLVRQALDAGHEVTAVVRDASKLAAGDRLTVVTADIAEPDELVPAVTGADAVLSVLGPRGRGATTVVADGAYSAIEAMGKAGVRRYLMVGAAAMLIDSEDGLLVRRLLKPLLQRLLRHGFADQALAQQALRDSDLDWTIVSPPRLLDRDGTGTYRTAVDRNIRGGRQIARADVATCLLDLADDQASIGHLVSVAD